MRFVSGRMWGCAMLVVLALAAGNAAAENRIAGTVRLAGVGLPEIALQLSDDDASWEARSGADGGYAFAALPDGEYRLAPRSEGYEFKPASRSIRLQDFSASGLDFEASVIVPAPIATPPAAAAPVVSVEAPAPAAIAESGIRGRVIINGAPAAGVTVSYNMVKSPKVHEQQLPATLTDAQGYYRLPRLPAEPRDAPLWIEARHAETALCPAQIFPSRTDDAEGAWNFRSCEPPKPQAAPHRLAGRVIKNARGVAGVGIHQAFATRHGADYSHTEFGPAVAYTDDEGRWSFSAPSVSARTLTSGFMSYLTAVLPKGPEFCPPQIPLGENLKDAGDLDFSVCDPVEEDLPPEGVSAILAPPQGAGLRNPQVAMFGEVPAVAWMQDGADGAVSIQFSRWDRGLKHWTGPLQAALAHPDAGKTPLAFAANAKTLALAYEDHDAELGTHVALILSADGGRTWQAQKLGNFADHSAAPALALGSLGDIHLAYWYTGAENLRRIVYQRKRPGGEFRAVALPLTNILNQESGLWALPSPALALDENDVPAISYFLAGPDDYLQLAFWKSGMPVAVKIMETQLADPQPEMDLALYGGNASVFYRLDAGAGPAPELWAAEGDYGERWSAPVKLEPGGGARGDGALGVIINHEGDRVFAAGSAGGGSWWLVHGANLKLLLSVAGNASLGSNTAGLDLALDAERRVNAVYVNAADGSLSLYRQLLP